MQRDNLKNRNIVSVSWGDHLIFGEGDGKLDSPSSVRKRMHAWKTNLAADSIHWRCTRNNIKGKYSQARGDRHFSQSCTHSIQWDVNHEIPKLAHDIGLKVFLYVALFDEGWPLLPKKIRAVSYHNKIHYRRLWHQNYVMTCVYN